MVVFFFCLFVFFRVGEPGAGKTTQKNSLIIRVNRTSDEMSDQGRDQLVKFKATHNCHKRVSFKGHTSND